MCWKKIYDPKLPVDYEEEPLPRFGHTIHFYQDKLYIIGGEFDNWLENKFDEGIMCIFDIEKSKWEMLKEIYDNELYQRKKEEKLINLQILSFQQISNKVKTNNQDKTKTEEKTDINQSNKGKNNLNSTNNTLKVNKTKNNLHKNIKSKRLSNSNINLVKNRNIANKNLSKLNNKKQMNTIENIKQDKVKIKEKTTKFPVLRRNHISIVIGKNIFLYGGISQTKGCLNDCWIYSFTKNKWSLLESIGRYPPPLYGHCACLVLDPAVLLDESLTVYHKPNTFGKTSGLLKREGIFFFGGQNDNKIPTNLLFRMVIGIRPVIFDIPEISGIPPSPRIDATMNFYAGNNIIIIHGGRNDLKNEIYNDIYLLDMEKMNWICPKFENQVPVKRYEHKSFIVSSKLFIFGGSNGERLFNFDFSIFNLDFFDQNELEEE